MTKTNKHFQKLSPNYLFFEIEKRTAQFKKKGLINLGIGDVTLPLAPSVVDAICKATKEMGYEKNFDYSWLVYTW